MPCKKTINKFNDLLDKTLSAGEEYEVQAHLAACPHCRGEFQLVKNADDLLRATVLEMVAEIEVPSFLNQRLAQVLAGEKKRQSGRTKLFSLLQAPAFAVAMLMVVLATGIFGYYRVLSVPQSQMASDSASVTEPAPLLSASHDQLDIKDGAAFESPDRAVSPLESKKVLVADGTTGSIAGAVSVESIARQNALPGHGDGEAINPKAAADLAQASSTGEQSKPMVSSQSSGVAKMSISSMVAPRQGTLQEATREVGFAPAIPGYLTPGAELKNVTWIPGTVYLEYQVDQNSFKLKQSRVTEAGVTAEEGGQLIDINGAKAYLQETRLAGDQLMGYTNVSWQSGEWVFTVDGNLPREEILNIALSIK